MHIGKRGTAFLINALFLGPITIILIVIVAFPLGYAFVVSSYYWSLLSGLKRFVGLTNYINLLLDPFFYSVLKITAIYTGLSILIQLGLGIALGLLVEAGVKQKLKGVRFAIIILIIPMIIAPILTGFFFKTLYSPQFGLLNQILINLGLKPILWVNSKDTALLSLVIADTWQWTSFMFIVLFSGLMALPAEPVEAAIIDGAEKWQIAYFIKLPLLRPIMQVALLMRAIDSIKYLDLVYVLTQGGPGSSTEILSFFTYRTGFVDFRIGFSAAIGTMELIVILLLCYLLIKTVKIG